MLTKIGSTWIDDLVGDTVDVTSGVTTLIVNASGLNETFTGGAKLASVTNRGTGESFTFVQGSMSVADYGSKTSMTLGNGNASIVDYGNGNTYKIGNTASALGKSSVTLYGGNATVTAGDGAVTVVARGANENVTLGNGSDTVIVYGPGITGATSDVFHLGNGAKNSLTLYGSGNTVYGGTGMTFITGLNVNNTVVVNAAGGQVSFGGTAIAGGHMDLTQILAGQGAVDASTIGKFVSVSQNTITVTGAQGVAKITMGSAAGPVTLASLTQNNFFVLPVH